MPLLLLIALPIILIYLLHKHRKSPKTRVPPGPPRLPLIGNLHQFGGAGNLPVYLWKLSKKYSPLIQLKLGSVPVVVVSSPKLAKEVLKTQDLSFCSWPKHLWQQKLSYNFIDMVFSSYGDHWREMRKITAIHLFSLKKTQSFRPIREEEVSRLITKISSISHASSSSSDKNVVINLSEMTMSLGIILICRIAFGKRYEEHGHEKRRFEKLLHEANDLMGTFFVCDYLPSFSWVDKLTGVMDRLNKTINNLDSFYQEFIDEHLVSNRVKKMKKEEKDILDTLIQLKEEKSCS
ncbi:hypothetical protein C2S51_020767 [Perilla frutescens var. frutescens]|nr:hypothetical protein C2S51_020767 [Perilla frutescens var. frutescens]